MVSRRKFCLSGLASAAAISLPAQDRSPKVGAYYYPWYDSDGRHWDQGYDGKENSEGPKLGRYSSRSPRTIRKHIDWSGEMGIDHWITSWWGPESWEDHTLRRYVLPILEEDEQAPEFCIFYECEGLLGLDPDEGIVFDSEAVQKFSEHFRFLCREYFSHPRYLRFEGRPVVYLYLSRAFAGNYEQAIGRVRGAAAAQGFDLFLVGDEVYWGEPELDRIKLFDAVTAYNMHGPERFAGLSDWQAFLDECQDLYAQYQEAAREVSVAFIPGVMPGFDSKGAGGSHYSIPRSLREGASSGTTLKAFLQMARPLLDGEYPAIAITSFNEWHEGTQLEPSVSK